MRNVVSWKPLVLGASFLLYGAGTAFATETDHLYPTPSTGFMSVQQDGRQINCHIVDKSGPIVGANVVVKGTTIGNISDMDGRAIIENVPANAPLLDEDGYLDQLSAAVQAAGGSFVDVRQTLAAHKSEYIYYRTDHHWTSLGAYYAYSQLCQTLGLTPFDTAAHTALTADGFYGTHYAKARTWNAVPDVITYYDLANTLTVWNVTAAGQPAEGQTTGLYDTEKLSVYDKYAMFLHGNNGLSRVQGNGSGRILVIKDSYANCFVPYLTANYADIDVVDFRNYNYGLDQLIADNGYDQILVLYNFDSFKSDPYLYRAGVTG